MYSKKRFGRNLLRGLIRLFQKNTTSLQLKYRMEIGCQYYSAVGMGKMEVKFLGDDSGEVVLPNTFDCKQLKGIECGDEYGEFVGDKS